jgi:hypothetical protein
MYSRNRVSIEATNDKRLEAPALDYPVVVQCQYWMRDARSPSCAHSSARAICPSTGLPSRKRAFRKYMAEVGGLTSQLHDALEKHLTEFDDKFRTAESHGTGALRKWSFLMLPMNQTPEMELMGPGIS